MRIYLTASPEEAQAAGRFSCPLAHAAYRIGEGSVLLRRNLLLKTRGGLLCVSDREAPVIGDPEALAAAALRECGRRGYQGVLADFDQPPAPDRQALLRRLGDALAGARKALYVPERYMEAGIRASVIIGTAVSGGSFSERLREAVRRWGGGARLALDAERLRMDFPLPCPAGVGSPLSREELETLLEDASPFFSQELCARYFTYRKENQGRFVLFDDPETLRQKLRIGAALGIPTVFFTWQEVEDIAQELFPLQR